MNERKYQTILSYHLGKLSQECIYMQRISKFDVLLLMQQLDEILENRKQDRNNETIKKPSNR